MGGGINRREFLKHSAVTAAVLSASPQIVFGVSRVPARGTPKTVAEIDKGAIRKFASRLRGRALLPGDRGYELACQLWTGQIPKRPGLVVRCAGAEDIVAAVKFARDHGLLLAVRGGGHSLNSTCEGGMLINSSGMKKIAANPAKRIARVQAGLTAADLDKATCAFGLAAVLGECPSVGISGLTLGGGLGRLMGQHGALCDNLLSADVVTADGVVLRASAGENHDLFWGIRGGGNLGIVTSFEYRLHPVGQVLSGMLRYPVAEARAVLRFFGEYMLTAPDELDALVEIGSGILQYAPDAQGPTVVINVCCGGDLRAADKALRPLRAFSPPAADTIRPMPYLEAQALGDLTPLLNHTTPRYSGYSKFGFLTRLADGAIDPIAAHCEKPPSASWSVALDHYMHGAISRVPKSEMAFSLRQSGYSFRIASFEEGPGTPEASIAWVKSLNSALEPSSDGKIYLNYLTDQGEQGVRAAFGSNYPRLAALKKKYDPTNFFRLNPNIEPAPRVAAEAGQFRL